MNRLFILAVAISSSTCVFAQKPGTKPAAKTTTAKQTAKPAVVFKNNKDSVSYGIGIRIMQSLKSQGLENMNLALLNKAMTDIAQNKPLLMDDAAIAQCMTVYQQEVSAVKSAAVKKQSADFLAANAKKPGVISLPSGLQYQVITTGTSLEKPLLTSKVRCHYTGTLIDGTKFDSSVDRGQPATFSLNGVIQGWQDALQMMTVGSKWRLFLPSHLAYGDFGSPPTIQPGAALIFEVELLGIEN